MVMESLMMPAPLASGVSAKQVAARTPLSPAELEDFSQNGFFVTKRLFSEAELAVLRAELPAVLSEDSARRVLEKNGVVRTVFASHLSNTVFACLSRLERLVEPAKQFLGSEVYIHQFKINAKMALDGDHWEWHQDFLYWKKEDLMPAPRVLTMVLFIEEVNEFNGPMLIIPGSHLDGVIDLDVHEKYRPRAGNGKEVEPSWAATLTADLKYKIDKSTLLRLIEKRRIQAVTGPAGTVMFFHGNLFHASADNLSPWDRYSVFISYNSVKNALKDNEHPRPEYIAARDFRPLVSVPDNALLELQSKK